MKTKVMFMLLASPLFMFANGRKITLAPRRGTACENRCYVLYSEQRETCYQMFGPNSNNPDNDKLNKCLLAIWNNFNRCMKDCAGDE